MKTKNILVLGCLAFSTIGFSQLDSFEVVLAPRFSRPADDGWMHFNVPNNIAPGACFQHYKAEKGDLDNDMALMNVQTDSLTHYTHYKYQQTYKGVPVEGAGCIEHFDSKGNLIFTNAKHAINIRANTVPLYDESNVVNHLLTLLPTNNLYVWQDSLWELQRKIDLADSNATWFPKPTLMLAVDEVKDMHGDISGSRYKLAYEINVNILNPIRKSITFYVDAIDGTILKTLELEIENVQADVYGYGNRLIDAAWQGGLVNKYYLFAQDNNHNIHTKKFANNSDPWGQWPETKKAGPDWGDTYLTESTAHYHVTNTWDYFYNTFGRVGYDGTGLELRVATQLPEDNAYYSDPIDSPHYLYFGHTAGGHHYGYEPSVVAHEFTHGITKFTANLTYVNESGALNESFSDIFGIVVHAQALDGGVTDWIQGNFIPNALELTRSLANPTTRGVHWEGDYELDGNGNYVLNQYGNYIPIYTLGQPKSYFGSNWCSTCPSVGIENVDNGGIHINSGVQNRWFYLLSAGDNNSNIQGIGMTKAARIAYLALTSNLMSSSQFYDSKNATIEAAIQLFGECSQEHISVVRSWNAVNISAINPCPSVSVNELVEEDDVLIYPNPTSSILNFEISKSLEKDVIIYDLNGKVAKTLSIKNTYYSTDISELEQGTYFVQFVINGQSLVKRIVLQ